MAELETVYAVHNFDAENDDELTFQIGETVLVIQKDDGFDDGWWKGQNIRGEVGLFPMNYITFDRPTAYQLTELPTPSTSDSAIRKKPSYIDTTSHFEDECSESPSVRSSYSFTCPITSSTNGPLSTMSNNSSYSNNALRRSVISTLFLPNLRSTSPEDWDVDQVEVWLNAMNFECIAMNFKVQEITGDILLELNMETLKELDIPTFGKRFKVHSAISALREECSYEPSNRMSITSSTYSEDQRFHQRSSTSPSTIRFSNPICNRQSTSYPSNLVVMEKHYRRRSQHSTRKFDDDQDHPRSPQSLSNLQTPVTNSPITPTSVYDIMDVNSQNYQKEHYQNQRLVSPVNKQGTDLIQQAQKRQTVLLPMAHRSSMNIYSNRHAEEAGSVTPDIEGWLHKQSCKYKKWNKRWFVLKGPNLFYFKSPKDVRMKGIINLRGYRIIPDETIQPGKYSFKAQHEEERTFYFYTDLDTSMKAWISSLMKATISRDFSAPVLSSSKIPTVSLDVARRMRPRPPSVLLYRKDNHINLSPRSYEASYGGGFPAPVLQNPHTSAAGVLKNTASDVDTADPKEDQPNQDSGFDSNDQEDDEEEEEEADMDEEDDRELDEGVEFDEDLDDETDDEDLQDETEDARSSSDHDVDPPACMAWTSAEYIQWINAISITAKISELQELRQGDILIELLEELSRKKVQQLPPSNVVSDSMFKLDNIVAIFKFMSTVGITIDDQYTVKDIFSGNEEKIMLMLQSILNWSIQANETTLAY